MSRADAGAERLARAFALEARRWAERLVAVPAFELAPPPASAAERLARAKENERSAGRDQRLPELVEQVAFAVSLSTSAGHVCARLAQIDAGLATPLGTAELRARLLASGVVGTPAARGAAPLILDDGDRLYLHRYFDYEVRLAERLRAARDAPPRPVGDGARTLLQALFTAGAADLPDRQQLAAALALVGSLAIVSGGPGTGKTSTVVRLLGCLLADAPDTRIALAAPTGKAAARLLEALRERAGELAPALRERLPQQSFTVHRLLGLGRDGAARHDRARPLPIDVLVVDEASMLDLALATRLLEAVPAAARIVLLGDRNQLAAVEAGAVFSELAADPALSAPRIQLLARLCDIDAAAIGAPAPGAGAALQDSVVWLARSFRFGADSPLAALAADINAGRADQALARLAAPPDGSLDWADDAAPVPARASMQPIVEGYAAYVEALRRAPRDVGAISAAFTRFRVLCAVRDGARGVDAANELATRAVRAALGQRLEPGGGAAWFAGRPVMVLSNDYGLQLFNGDVGIALPDAAGELKVHFPAAGGGFRAIAPARLPEHDTAFAITVHRVQGSEFDDVLLLLPAAASRVVTRELLYTAVTRSRGRLRIVAPAAVLRLAIDTPSERDGGLRARLAATSAGDRNP